MSSFIFNGESFKLAVICLPKAGRQSAIRTIVTIVNVGHFTINVAQGKHAIPHDIVSQGCEFVIMLFLDDDECIGVKFPGLMAFYLDTHRSARLERYMIELMLMPWRRLPRFSQKILAHPNFVVFFFLLLFCVVFFVFFFWFCCFV